MKQIRIIIFFLSLGMLRFLRSIRKSLIESGAARKYAVYAIGEILLVVAGILIALQVDNWNSRNTEQAKIRELAMSLVQDLEKDIGMVQEIRTQTIQIISRIDSLSRMVQQKRVEDISNIDFIVLSWNLLYKPFSWNRATLDQLKSSGSLQYIKDMSLIKKISDYDAFSRHMDEDYLNDKTKSENAVQLTNKVTNNNYPNLEKLRKEALLMINNIRYNEFDVMRHEEYLKAKDYDLKLITRDINEVQEAVNSLIRLQFHYTIRSQVELPRLIGDAEELISILKEKYNH